MVFIGVACIHLSAPVVCNYWYITLVLGVCGFEDSPIRLSNETVKIHYGNVEGKLLGRNCLKGEHLNLGFQVYAG